MTVTFSTYGTTYTDRKTIYTDIKKIFLNFSHLAFGEFTSKVFGFLTTVYLARVLGSGQFGEYSWVIAVYAYLYMLGNFGFETYGIRSIAADVSADVIDGIFILRGLYVLVLLASVIFVHVAVIPSFNYLLLLQSFSLLLLPLNVQYIFRGLGKSKYDSMYKITQAALFLAAVYLFMTPDTLVRVPILWFCATAVASAVFFWLMRGMVSFQGSMPSVTFLHSIFKETLPIGFAGVLIMFYMNFETVLLGFYVGNHLIGLYTAAFKVYSFGYSLLALFYITFLPHLSAASKSGAPAANRSYVSIMLVTAAFIATAGVLTSEFIIRMMFGEMFADAVPVMKILFLSLAAGCFNFAFMNPLQAAGKDAAFIKVLSIRSGVFVVLCFAFIPTYGINGAAWVTLAAEAITIPFAVYFAKLHPDPVHAGTAG